jgi:uncharacterized membrane protein
MVKVDVNITIDRPPDEVFAYIANFENNPRWQKGMQSCKFTSDGPLGVGSTYEQVAKFMGKEILTTFEVINYQPGKMIEIKSVISTFPLHITRSVEPHNGGTHVQAIIEGEPGGLFKLMTPFMGMMVKRSVNADYARLKLILESGD